MKTLRVLVVDDELGMRLAVTRVLRGHSISLPELDIDINFDVDQAGTGEEGLEKIQAGPPDILLLDHKLPGMSGLDVLNQISDKQYDLQTIMITAYASLETAIVATKRGAFDFLAKPFIPEELKAAVRKAAKHLLLQRQARQLAEEKRQVRFQFISVLAHELKAPLGAIEGYLYLMRDQSLGSDIAAYGKVTERCLIRLDGMRKMILDLLDLTRLESGQKKRELGPVDLIEVARMSIETVQPTAAPRGIAIDLSADGDFHLVGDRGELEIVLNNLVSNAVKYNRDGGRVDVKLARDNGALVIKVADTGIGMTPEESAKLFGEFVRIKNKQTRDIMGSGLGLSIVKKIAQLYHGDVSVASELGIGSTFTVILRPEQDPPGSGQQEA